MNALRALVIELQGQQGALANQIACVIDNIVSISMAFGSISDSWHIILCLV